MLTLAAFVLALGILIVAHEYGHYRVALACGVKVLRFSIGFGKVLYRWHFKGGATEFVICAFPVGGYVKMLDEREAAVPPSERLLAFNRQPLRARVAIVVAGPLANLALAALLYAAVNWIGVEAAAPILARPEAGSVADQAGLRGGERVQQAALGDDQPQAVESFDELRWFLTRAVLEGQNLHLALSDPAGTGHREVLLKLSSMNTSEVNADLFQRIGLAAPFTRPVIGTVMAGGAADKAGLRDGDLVQQVGDVPVVDGQQLRGLIRASVRDGQARSTLWKINRAGGAMELNVEPEPRPEGVLVVGRIGAYVGSRPELVLLRYGAVEGLWRGVTHTWEVSALTLKMMEKMLLGEVSIKNLSGPLTIADYAGKSAGMGLTAYLMFLALISVSLGVLNLLPLPVLDGGHLMYYLWEGVTGKPVADVWMENLQRGGVALLLLMMLIALFNDVTRLFG